MAGAVNTQAVKEEAKKAAKEAKQAALDAGDPKKVGRKEKQNKEKAALEAQAKADAEAEAADAAEAEEKAKLEAELAKAKKAKKVLEEAFKKQQKCNADALKEKLAAMEEAAAEAKKEAEE